MSAGCYQITHRPSGAFYIGSSVDFGRRWAGHRRGIRNGSHENPKIRRLGNSLADFEFAVLLVCAPADRKFYEDRLLAQSERSPALLNQMLAGNVPSDDARAKVGAANRGRVHAPRSPEYCAKLSASHKGKTISVQQREKLSAACKGYRHTPEALAKLRAHSANAKKTHCPKGHPLSGDNLQFYAGPKRTTRLCRACRLARAKAKRLMAFKAAA